MKKGNCTRKIVSLLLAVILAVCAAYPVGATDLDTSGAIQESDLIMPPEAAPYVAEFFIRDMIATDQTAWDETTAVVNTVTMYDKTGETPTAYSVELTSGYVIVSAYVDVPNPILEWADEAEPVYAGFSDQPVAYDTEGSGETKVVYLGTLNYLLDNGNDTLETVEGTEVERDDLTNPFDEVRDIANVPEGLMEMIEDRDDGIMPILNGVGEEIDHPSEYAYKQYPGTWKCIDWTNKWENYTNYARQNDFPRYPKACVPIAATNILQMYGKKRYTSGITGQSDSYVFSKVMSASGDYYTTELGVYPKDVKSCLQASMSAFGLQNSTRVSSDYLASHANLKTATTEKRLLLLMVDNHSPYNARHAVVAYAFTHFRSDDSLDIYGNPREFSFVKICDGLCSQERYLDIKCLEDFGDRYWEVNFSVV